VWLGAAPMAGAGHGAQQHGAAGLASGLAATVVHSSSYLVVTTLIAWVVFTWLGVGLLRKAWINLDAIWAVALIASGALTIAIV
jgi:predicted neutral ceramidase superfamily lipid hydrolase